MEVKQSSHDREDFVVEVRASTLQRCRKRVLEIAGARIRPIDLCLAVAAMSVGGVLGAWQSGMTMNSEHWWVFYIFSAHDIYGSAVSYTFLLFVSVTQPAEKAKEILEELPDPDETTGTFVAAKRLAGTWKSRVGYQNLQ